MKTRLFLLLLSVLQALASEPSVRIEKGLNLVKTWNDGTLISEFRQVLSSFTNLLQVEKYWQSTSPTQRISIATYRGTPPMPLVEGIIVEWNEGTALTNAMSTDSGAWSVFQSGGSQGALVAVNGNERTQIINCSTLRCQWQTNGDFHFNCQWDDDQATMILWFRTNSVSSGLPWFIGSSCTLAPGQGKSISLCTPVDHIWRYMGFDKCFQCGEPCWLAGWPESAASKNNGKTTASSYGRSLQLEFSGQAGVIYAVQQSFNLRDWSTLQTMETTDQGGLQTTLPAPQVPSFFRFSAVQTASMTEEETAEAVREIQQFNQP